MNTENFCKAMIELGFVELRRNKDLKGKIICIQLQHMILEYRAAVFLDGTSSLTKVGNTGNCHNYEFILDKAKGVVLEGDDYES